MKDLIVAVAYALGNCMAEEVRLMNWPRVSGVRVGSGCV